jgi:hypothetical protein
MTMAVVVATPNVMSDVSPAQAASKEVPAFCAWLLLTGAVVVLVVQPLAQRDSSETAAISGLPRVETLRVEGEFGDFAPIRFDRLSAMWKQEAADLSSATAMAMLPSYQRIIAMGPVAIPLILGQLEAEGDQPDHWFWALRSLTEVDPVPPAERGNVRAMAKSWIDWSKAARVPNG